MEEQKSNNNLILSGIVIESRKNDNFINATQLCKAGGKYFKDWYKLSTTKELIKTLEINLGYPRLKVVDKKVGGNHSGSWIHPQLSTHLAMWISPKFAIKVSQWIEEWKLYSKENQERYIYELSNLEPSRNFLKEKELRNKYQVILNSEKEVETDVGYIDLLTKTDLIEIKNATNWKHGIGQLICYGTYYKEHKKWLYLFNYEELSELDRSSIDRICLENKINYKFIS